MEQVVVRRVSDASDARPLGCVPPALQREDGLLEYVPVDRVPTDKPACVRREHVVELVCEDVRGAREFGQQRAVVGGGHVWGGEEGRERGREPLRVDAWFWM